MSGLLRAVVNIGSKAYDALKGTVQETATEVTFDVKVKLMVEGCNYPKWYGSMKPHSNKAEIEKAAQLVYKDYKLDCGILSFSENGRMVNYLELSGKGTQTANAVPVEYKGSVYSVLVKLFLPANYPDQTPLIRIINTDRKHCATQLRSTSWRRITSNSSLTSTTPPIR